MDGQTGQKKRDRAEESPESDTPEAKRIREDLFELLDDADTVPAGGSDDDDLYSVMKSFEQEISGSVGDLTSVSGDSLPELGYLLRADDDELGLPAAEGVGDGEGAGEVNRVEVEGDPFEFGEFDDPFGVGVGFGFGLGEEGGDDVAVGGIFDFGDGNCGALDYGWGPEGLPTV